jgi:hypothetical protein
VGIDQHHEISYKYKLRPHCKKSDEDKERCKEVMRKLYTASILCFTFSWSKS